MTRAPTGAKSAATPAPTAATTPHGSWPAMTGPPDPRPREAAALPTARYGCRSLPHMPEALMARTTSPGPGAGSGNSCRSSFRSPRKTTPRMVMTPPVEVLAVLLSCRLVDEPGGGDVLDGEAERFEHGRLPSPGRLRAIEDLPGLGM